MDKASIITDMRIRVLRARRRRAHVNRRNEANLIERAGEDMYAGFHGIRAKDNAAVCAARRAIKSARISRAEHEWARRRAHSAANLPTQRPERAAPLPT